MDCLVAEENVATSIEKNVAAAEENTATSTEKNIAATEEDIAATEEDIIATEDIVINTEKNIIEAKQTEVETKSEETIYQECDNYLTDGQYPLGANKQEKAIIRKRAKHYQKVDGILHYKGKDGLRQVITDVQTKRKILEACHDDKVGGCHFGRDKTAAKVSARYYWRGIIQDVETWVSFTYFTHSFT